MSMRRTPASPSPSVPRTLAGVPSCSSAQRRIWSWSVVVLVFDPVDAVGDVRVEHARRCSRRSGQQKRPHCGHADDGLVRVSPVEGHGDGTRTYEPEEPS
jgi:hypothetical protein